MRPAGRGEISPERAGTERPERRVETLALPERSGDREQRGSARRSGLLGLSSDKCIDPPWRQNS